MPGFTGPKMTATMQIVGSTPSIVAGHSARIYRFSTGAWHLIAEIANRYKALTFSFFAKTLFGSEKLRVRMETPHAVETADFEITNEWSRYELSLRNKIGLSPLKIFVKPLLAFRQTSEIAIEAPQLEEGLFATSPIYVPNIVLPIIVSEPHDGVRREADELYLKKPISSKAATVFVVATSLARTVQYLENQFYAFLSIWHPELEVTIGISGADDGRIAIRKRTKAADEIVLTSLIAGRLTYFVCCVFDRNTITIIVNGAIVAVTKLEEEVTFTRLYLGCASGRRDSLSGHLRQVVSLPTPLLYPRILQIYREVCPDAAHFAYDYLLEYFKYAVLDRNHQFTLDRCLEDPGFNFFIAELRWALPTIYDQFAPNKRFTETQVRDWVYALICRPETRHGREVYSEIGRTDLDIRYRQEKDASLGREAIDKNFKVEFKIWGRNGYREAPSQPLKYLSESEFVAAFVMIDRRARPNIAEFENIVRNNKEYPCLGIYDIKLLDSDLKYFVSFHEDKRYRSPRMVINVYFTIP